MGRITAVVERGDDEVPGSSDIVIQHVAHRVGGIDPELSRNSGYPTQCPSGSDPVCSMITLSVALMNSRSLASAPATGAPIRRIARAARPPTISLFTDMSPFTDDPEIDGGRNSECRSR